MHKASMAGLEPATSGSFNNRLPSARPKPVKNPDGVSHRDEMGGRAWFSENDVPMLYQLSYTAQCAAVAGLEPATFGLTITVFHRPGRME